MASTTQTWNDLNSKPNLSALAVNDDVTINGQHSSISRGRALIRDAKIGNGKVFKQKVVAPHSINITRKA